MGVAWERRANDANSVFLAGLQAGMAAVLWMLAWLGVSSAWQQGSFWAAENLWASAFHGAAAIHRGFSTRTLSGLALYLLVYTTLGGIFAATVRTRFPRFRLLLIAVFAAVCWYYLSFHGIWRTVSPLVALLHPEQPTLLGHVIYGAALAQFPRYLPTVPPPHQEEPAPVPVAVESDAAPDVPET